LSAWSWNNNDGGDLFASTQAAAIGSYGLQAVIDDTTNIKVARNMPNAEKHYSARFYFDPNSISLPNNYGMYIFSGSDATGWDFCLNVARFDQYYRLSACIQDDSNVWRDGRGIYITDAWQAIEMEWQAASAPGTNDGFLKLWINDVLVDTIDNIDSDTQYVSSVALGAISNIPSGVNGTIYFDGFVSQAGSHIGLDPNAPAVSAPMTDLVFMDNFETNDLSLWSSTTVADDGDLSLSSASAMFGSYGLQALIDDTTSIYAVDRSPKDEPQYRARFYFDPNSVSIPSGNGFSILGGSGDVGSVYRVMLNNVGGSYMVQLLAVTDTSVWVTGTQIATLDEPQLIEIEYKAASAAGANDGTLKLWLNETLADTIENLDNETRLIDDVYLGAASSLDPGTSGTIYFDEFESRRNTYVGPVFVALTPTLILAKVAPDTNDKFISLWFDNVIAEVINRLYTGAVSNMNIR
jgi:hypothetical protein